jgi:calcineurin-like phosphoesterase family protein
MNTWFTSDTHFGHANIIVYCKRPFKDVEEMDAELIRRWNARVQPGDTVYHLGDFALAKGGKKIPAYLERLNGQIHLITGNHDPKQPNALKGFADVKAYKEIKVGEQDVILCHYAFRVWNKRHYGSWNLHGHSHGTLKRDFKMKQLDVGVDCWNYAPISFEEVAKEMEKSTSEPVDYPGDREDES